MPTVDTDSASDRRAEPIMSQDNWPGPPESPLQSWPTFEIEFVIESPTAGVERCSLYPRDTTNERRLREWITAEEGAYVDVSEIR